MLKFIKLSVVHPQSAENDTTILVRIDKIESIQVAVDMDRRVRKEVNSMVNTMHDSWGVKESSATIALMIENAQKEFPEVD